MELEDLDIPSISDEEAAFLNSLDQQTATLGGETANNAANDDEAGLEGATGLTLMLINVAESLGKNAVHEQFGWSEQEKQSAAIQIAPALAKNGGQMPEFLEPYKEEIVALGALFTLGVSGWMQAKEFRKLEEAKAKNASKSELRSDDVAA